ncbi:MAG: Gldg family protein [Alphaproteobacteria bacterium]|nr:Gldg family protein [Alphaproteobacteria bacterium]
MQQFTALLKKELGSYYKSYFAYLIFAIYLFASAGSSCYFGSYLAIKDTTVFSLFYLQPVILLLIIPALTMKTWSDEYKSGTAEFLLTQPVDDFKIVFAKVSASFLFCVSMSLCLLPQIIYTGTWLQLDTGNIVCCFIGLWLLQFSFCALGCLLSSFSRYMIIAYITSVFVMALLLTVKATGLYRFFNNFLLGEIGFVDICYFVLFSAAFIWLNMQVLLYKRNVQRNKLLKLSSFAVLLFTGVGLCVTLIGLVFTGKFDMTSGSIYTPSEQSAQIVSQLKEPYTLDIYIAKDYKNNSPEYFHYYEQIKRFTDRYARLSGGLLTVRSVEVEPYSELENAILRSGLYYEENTRGSFDYFGAFLRNDKGDGVVLKHFITERRQYLEKDIDKALLKVSKSSLLKTIGIYMDSTQNLDEYQGLMQNIENDFNTIVVTSQTYEISPLLDMVILVNPKSLPQYFIYAVDQYLVKGGKILLLFDMLTEGQSEVTNLESIQISKLFNHWGIILNNSFTDSAVVDEQFKTAKNNVQIKDALSFTVKNNLMDIQPLLKDGDKYIGVLLSGTMTSDYRSNPFGDKEFFDKMDDHTAVTLMPSKLAVIGDVDIIEDYLWASDMSQSKDPFSAIAKNDNIEFIRNVIEDMLDIPDYRQMKVRTGIENPESIGQQINLKVNSKFVDKYVQSLKQLEEQKLFLAERSGGNQEKLDTLMQISEAGQQIASLEKEINRMAYQMKRLYDYHIGKVLALNVLVFPSAAVLILFLGIVIMVRRQKRHIRRFLDE